jgi:hypothetical protein
MKSLFCSICTAVAIVSLLASHQVSAAGQSGQEIVFAVAGGSVTNMSIEGTDSEGRWQTWTEAWPTGTRLIQTDGYEWQGTVVLIFDIQDLGRRSCVIDYLAEAPGSTTVTIMYTEGKGCNGESGNAKDDPVFGRLFYAASGGDGYQLVKAAKFGLSSYDCLMGIAEVLAGARSQGGFKTIRACTGAVLAPINLILLKYNRGIADSPAHQSMYASGRFSFESYNYHGYYIRHRNFVGELTPISSSLDRQDGTLRALPGLADASCISFESVNYPGYFLRHQDFRLKLQSTDNSQLFEEDATFCNRPGLADPALMSFESHNYPGYYIRHRNFHLYLENGAGDLFRSDATFRVALPLAR